MFGKVLGKLKKNLTENSLSLLLNEGKIIQSLRELLIVLFLAISTLSFSQVHISKSDYTRGRISGKSAIKFYNKDKYTDVVNWGIDYKLNNPDSLVTLQWSSNYSIRLDGLKKVDTIIAQILGELDDTNKSAVHIDFSRAGTGNHSAEYYISLKGENLFMPIATDTIEPWLSLIEIERTKKFGKTVLKRIGTPFQHKDFWAQEINNSHIFKIETTENCQAYFVMERQDWFEIAYSQMEFSFDYKDHGIGITDLDPGTTYKIWSVIINEAGEQKTSGPILYTVREDTERPLVGFQFYIVYSLDNEITSTSAKIRTWTTENCSIQLKLSANPYDLLDYPTDTGISASHPNKYYQHTRTFEQLEPDSVYYWQATNTNASGKKIVSSIHRFKTLK